MNILIIGSGGREHTLTWKIKKSNLCERLFVAPGNAGTDQIATNVDLQIDDFDRVAEFVKDQDINMIVVGPEQPLVDGIYDYFEEYMPYVKVVGPSMKAAELEGSKTFAKKFMERHNIPTAAYREFTKDSFDEACEFIERQSLPIVLKCDGLAAGKGVLIIDSFDEAKLELKNIFNGKFGGAGQIVVIENFLDGIEFSVFALTDGKHYVMLPVAKDYKRIGVGDTGLNTGGMGAISPPPFVDDILMKKVEDEIVKPTINGFIKDDFNYKGFVFFGLINVNGQPKVIEYNCRLGDPETEVVLPRLKNDLVELFDSLFDDTLSQKEIKIIPQHAATVMMVSGGYPESYEKGKFITNIPDSSDSRLIFHAGTKINNNQVSTNGGRVIAITSLHDNFKEAVKSSLEVANTIEFEGKYFRHDIGFDL